MRAVQNALKWCPLLANRPIPMDLLRIYARVLALLGPEARLGWLLALGNLALAVAQFAEPVLFGRIIDALAGGARGTPAPLSTIAGLVAAWVAFGLFAIAAGVSVALHSGRLMKVMLSGTDALWSLWLDFFRDSFASVVMITVILPLSLLLNWRLGLTLMAVATVFGVLTALVVAKTDTLQRTVEEHYSNLAERASDTLGNIALVQGYARIEAEVSGLRNVVDSLLAAQMPVLSWWAAVAVITRASTTLTLLAIFVCGIWLHFRGEASIGDIVMFMNFSALLIMQLERFVRFVNKVFMDAPRLREFFDVLDTEPAVRDRRDAVDPGRLRGMVEFSDVSFSYDGKRAAVADLAFSALPGETVALVGPTGAGKSTALALLHRAFDPQSGVVRIDGMDIRALTLTGLRRNIGVVFQEVLLFNRSIAENLQAGKADATEAEMRDACVRAQALDFIERNPDGFAASAGERGRALSGGERQRLSIARALLKDPPVLILDEATSALDAGTEAKVQAALDEVMKHRTTFVIAHRLSTVRNATRILVFDEGRIVESGSFDELVARNGRFAALARAQFMVGAAPAPAPLARAIDDVEAPGELVPGKASD